MITTVSLQNLESLFLLPQFLRRRSIDIITKLIGYFQGKIASSYKFEA